MRRADVASRDVERVVGAWYWVGAFLCWFHLVGSLIEAPKVEQLSADNPSGPY